MLPLTSRALYDDARAALSFKLEHAHGQ